MLPNQDIFNNEFSQVTIDTESATFYTYLQNFAHRNNAAEILKRFVYYQIREGFWNKSSVKQHNIDLEKLNHTQENLILVEKNLTKNLEVFDKLKADLNLQIDSFSKILIAKQAESEEITALLTKSNSDASSISTLFTNASKNDLEISNLVESIKAKLDTVTENITSYQATFDKIESANHVLSDELKRHIEEAKTNLEESKTGNEFILGQKDEITKLIGMAADGSLGYKFNSRKEDLEKGVKRFWQWAVPGSIVIALIWVIVIFTTRLGAHLGNDWVNLVINLVKTSPVWLLVGFVFSQYGKERNLQEEYAFKSAIAMTLTAYSQMLSEDDKTQITNKSSKQQMLLKSIENLYTQPILKIEKPDRNESVSKQLNESLKSVADLIKSLKE